MAFTDDDTEDEERRKNYEADDEGRSRKKDRLYKRKQITFRHCLTFYHTIPTFKRKRKHCGKRRKCWSPAFSPFPTVFSTLS